MSQSWNNAWSSHVVLHFYRRITGPESQTRAHMQIVYAVGAAFDLATTSTIVVDDRLDESNMRAGCPTWHTTHPLTLPTDIAVLTSIGKRALRFLVPNNHPFKGKLLELYDDYLDYCVSYLSVAGARLQNTSNEEIRESIYYPVDQVTPETYRSFSWMRSGFYNNVLREAGRLLACCEDVISTDSRKQLYMDAIAPGNEVMCILDDIRDSRALNTVLDIPRMQLPLGAYAKYVTLDMMQDFLPGETHQTFLLASLELGRGESTTIKLGDAERLEIMTVLRGCYWPNPQGSREDPTEKESRIRRLCAMFLKYDLLHYLKEHVLPRVLREYFVTHHHAVEVLGLPMDLLSYPIGAMICEEKETRPDHVADEVRRIIDTPNTNMSEEDKFLQILRLVREI